MKFKKNKSLLLITIAYFFLFLLFYCVYEQYTNNFILTILIIIAIAWLIHIITLSILQGLQVRKEDNMREYVEKKELEEKYKHYKAEENSNNE